MQFSKRALLYGSLAVGVCALLLVLKLSLQSNAANPEAGPPAKKAPYSVSCLGRLVPGKRVLRLAAPMSSIVKKLYVATGEEVTKGQVIAILNRYAICKAAIQEAEANVARATAQLALVKAGARKETVSAQKAAVAGQRAVVNNVRTEYQRSLALLKANAITEARFDRVKATFATQEDTLTREEDMLRGLQSVRKEDLAVAESELEVATAAKKRAEAELESQVVRAPENAQILQVNTFAGEAVGPRGIVDLGDVKHMVAEAEVYISDIKRVRIGAEAVVTGEGFYGEVDGKVVEIGRIVDASRLVRTDPLALSDKRIVKVRIELADCTRLEGLSNSQVDIEIQP
ncbi:MAG: biotin/lipoyl-binding protein [Deltaproteobacteria bacterium]|jgi:HlyD family secretion protein|nr:biotin/lipoyl-binding protein [Deltaproteobacteria bacterium]